MSRKPEIQYFQNKILAWYEAYGRKFPWRKASISKYQCMIAEILLQRTRAEVIAEFLPNFIRKYHSWRTLHLASINDLQRDLRPIGLWRRRASSIRDLSREMVKRKGQFPKTREEIEALPGVGQYIANAILLFCYGEPQPLLDTNMARVLERVFGQRKMADIRYDQDLQQLALEVVTCESPKQINWAILDLAATVCLIKKPYCEKCPLSCICNYYQKKK